MISQSEAYLKLFLQTHALTHKKLHSEQNVLRNHICVYIHNLGVDGLYERILVGEEKLAKKKKKKRKLAGNRERREVIDSTT